MSTKLHHLEKDYILENYSTFGPKIISQKLQRSESTIISFAKQNGLILKKDYNLTFNDAPDFKYCLDFEKCFDQITPELSYWLGFFWADGLNSKGTLSIEIVREDGENLQDLFLNIFPFKITYRERPNRKPQMCFYVYNRSVSQKLTDLGKHPHSFQSHEKILNFLQTDELVKYFLRGLIDGDGSFYLNKHDKYGQFTLASNLNQDWSTLMNLLKDFNPFVSISKRKSGNSSVLRITGKENLCNFIKYLEYDTLNIGLSRKQQTALDIVKMYNEPKPHRTIYQYSKNKELLNTFNSIKDAAESLNVKKSAITNCLCKISKTAFGYIWSYTPL